MKQIYIAVIVFFFCLSVNAQSGKELKTNKRETETAYLRNTVLTIDGQTYDYRILKYYTEAQLKNMTPVKRNQIHFIYTSSYTVKGMGNCPSFSEKDIDVARLEILRKENTSTEIDYGKDCKVQVELISSKLLRQKMEELAK